jgi:hypothetical protein
MSRPPKPYLVLANEKKSHRTKKELKIREQGEKALATGVALKERPEVKANPIAHKEFLRINKLLKKIEKNDAIYETIINRYCLIVAECHDFEIKRDSIYKDLAELKQAYQNQELDAPKYFEMKTNLQKQIIALDKQIQTKRKMLLDIEKENVMTIAAALRSIPKKEDKSSNKLLEVLNGSKG